MGHSGPNLLSQAYLSPLSSASWAFVSEHKPHHCSSLLATPDTHTQFTHDTYLSLTPFLLLSIHLNPTNFKISSSSWTLNLLFIWFICSMTHQWNPGMYQFLGYSHEDIFFFLLLQLILILIFLTSTSYSIITTKFLKNHKIVFQIFLVVDLISETRQLDHFYVSLIGQQSWMV